MNVNVGDLVSYYAIGAVLPNPATVTQVFTNLGSVDLTIVLGGTKVNSVAWFDTKPNPLPNYPCAAPVLSIL